MLLLVSQNQTSERTPPRWKNLRDSYDKKRTQLELALQSSSIAGGNASSGRASTPVTEVFPP